MDLKVYRISSFAFISEIGIWKNMFHVNFGHTVILKILNKKVVKLYNLDLIYV